MQVPDEIRKCVTFLCCKAGQDLKLQGTAFFIGERIPETDRSIFFLVTARHVIDGIKSISEDQKVYIRVNIKNNGAQYIPSKVDSWVFHPDGKNVDVALIPLAPPNKIDWKGYPLERFVTDEVIAAEGIGVGEELFLAGLFINHFGSNRNIPVIRAGNIAAMPEEPVNTRLGQMDAYLVESRSIGGLSGSPVFVHLGLSRFLDGKVKTAKGGLIFYLLGLIHGHWDVQITNNGAAIDDTINREAVNVGMAIVTPAVKILEAIHQPKLEEWRKGVIKEVKGAKKAKKLEQEDNKL
jgi:hypothetical protein